MTTKIYCEEKAASPFFQLAPNEMALAGFKGAGKHALEITVGDKAYMVDREEFQKAFFQILENE